MLFGLLGIWLGGIAILLSGYFYTRAMRAALREQDPNPWPPPPKGGRGGTPGRKENYSTRAAGSGSTSDEIGSPSPRFSGRGPGVGVLPSDHFRHLGRRFFYLAMAGALLAAATLWVMLLGRHYEMEYVWKVTDNALPLKFRIAAFWAEQEGTFLLWLLYGFILSAVLLRRIGKNESYVMPFICAVQLFLFIMLTVMTPFKVVPQRPEDVHLAAWPGFLEMLGLGPVAIRPMNGQGLNALLQNLWMTIHPPIMFMGFSSTLIPCALALGALVKRDWDGWVRAAMPWALYAFMFLGFGKFLGGYWAYETLGWGGYWAWDPVENASFVPWLLSAALVHGLQVQQARGSWKQVNLLVAITAFLSFCYGTFLTRSGVLNEFSVHSFVSPGGLAMGLLLGFLLLFAIGFWGLWLARMRGIQSNPTYEALNERPFGLFLGIILFLGAAAIVLIGMSWPIISRSLSGKAASINYQFYNRALLPVGAFVALLMAVTPLLAWRRKEGATWKPGPLLRFTLGVGGLILLGCLPALFFAWRGNNAPALFLFTAAISLALVTNSVMLFLTSRQGWRQTGGWVMHVGFCLALIGVISTSVYSKDTQVVLAKGESKSLYGYNFTYTGIRPDRDGRDLMGMEVRQGDTVMQARPHRFAKGDQVYHTPGILKLWNQDLYIAPVKWTDGSGEVELKAGQSQPAGDQMVTFNRFVRNGGPPTAGGSIDIGVALNVTDANGSHAVTPHFIVHPTGDVLHAPVSLPGGGAVTVAKVTPNLDHPEESTVILDVVPSHPVDMAAFTISTKPLVNVLWLGGYMMFIGGIMAWRRRAGIAARAKERATEPASAPEEEKPSPGIRPKRRPGLSPEPAAMRE